MRVRKLWLPSAFLLLMLLPGSAAAQLSRAEKFKIFNKVWETVNKKYYDPQFNGVDWGAVRDRYGVLVEGAKDEGDFFALIKRMVGELGDIHTTVRTPDEVRARKRGLSVGAGLWVGEVEGRTVILGVAADSEAAAAGVQPGMILTGVDGHDPAGLLSAQRASIKSSSVIAVSRLAYGRLLGGPEGTAVRLTLLDPSGELKEVTLTRRPFNSAALMGSSFSSRRLPSGVGYIRFDEFNDSMSKQYKKALRSLKDAKGLIIDLRFNHGGSQYAMEEIAETLFAEKVSFGTVKTRTGKMPKFLGISLIPKEIIVGDDDGLIYSGPVAVLASNFSASAAEHFAAGLQESGRAKVVGQQSCGCMLGIMGKTTIKGGELYVSQLDFLTARGKRLEGAGVAPDVGVASTIQDVRSGFPAGVTAAEKILKETKESGKR
jgi:carboxyl-terminal processing protease